jgi:hypothetical protein
MAKASGSHHGSGARPRRAGQVVRPRFQRRVVERIGHGPHLEDDGVQAEVTRCVEDAQHFRLRLRGGQVASRWPVHVPDGGHPHAAELAWHIRQQHRRRVLAVRPRPVGLWMPGMPCLWMLGMPRLDDVGVAVRGSDGGSVQVGAAVAATEDERDEQRAGECGRRAMMMVMHAAIYSMHTPVFQWGVQ